MRVAEVMTTEPACCSPDASVQEAASLMVQNDCGCVPVVDDENHVMGIVTDRDIACRCVAGGKDASTPVSEVMTEHAQCCGADDDVEEATRIMAEGKVRRVPVVDESGCCVGMVSQADIVRRTEEKQHAMETVESVSEPTDAAAQTDHTEAGRSVG